MVDCRSDRILTEGVHTTTAASFRLLAGTLHTNGLSSVPKHISVCGSVSSEFQLYGSLRAIRIWLLRWKENGMLHTSQPWRTSPGRPHIQC